MPEMAVFVAIRKSLVVCCVWVAAISNSTVAIRNEFVLIRNDAAMVR
jgi:hypothetical protein